MALRAGSYDVSTPQWRGVIRDHSYPVYVCVHAHHTQPEATACAREALTELHEHTTLLAGWITYAATPAT